MIQESSTWGVFEHMVLCEYSELFVSVCKPSNGSLLYTTFHGTVYWMNVFVVLHAQYCFDVANCEWLSLWHIAWVRQMACPAHLTHCFHNHYPPFTWILLICVGSRFQSWLALFVLILFTWRNGPLWLQCWQWSDNCLLANLEAMIIVLLYFGLLWLRQRQLRRCMRVRSRKTER